MWCTGKQELISGYSLVPRPNLPVGSGIRNQTSLHPALKRLCKQYAQIQNRSLVYTLLSISMQSTCSRLFRLPPRMIYTTCSSRSCRFTQAGSTLLSADLLGTLYWYCRSPQLGEKCVVVWYRILDVAGHIVVTINAWLTCCKPRSSLIPIFRGLVPRPPFTRSDPFTVDVIGYIIDLNFQAHKTTCMHPQ